MENLKCGPLEIEDWRDRWNTGAQWHRTDYNETLVKYYDEVLKNCSNIFVPLCGKSIDLKWFYDRGHNVVGVEAVETAVKDFFKENCIPFVTETKDDVNIYKTGDNRLKLYVSNYFDLTSSLLEKKFDGVWDRGSYVAINVADRTKYCNLMASILVPGAVVLLETLEYNTSEYAGPPFSSTLEELESLLGKSFSLKLLDDKDLLPTHKNARESWGLKDFLKGRTLLLQRKNN